jgi:hypothetical protein
MLTNGYPEASLLWQQVKRLQDLTEFRAILQQHMRDASATV